MPTCKFSFQNLSILDTAFGTGKLYVGLFWETLFTTIAETGLSHVNIHNT